MSKTLKIILASMAGVALSLILILGGFLIGRSPGMFYPRYMHFGFGGFLSDHSEDCPHSGRIGHMNPGMMGEYFSGRSIIDTPLSLEESDQIIHEWLEEQGNDDLVRGEVMVFDNHSYVQIMEKSTGIGAMEVLIDPGSRDVYPEQGPNMMWNLKYSTMGHGRGMGWSNPSGLGSDFVDRMPVSGAEAVIKAQDYLDEYLPGMAADDHSVGFYGYYTLHVLEDGEVTGMLSVHGESGQVFYHHWHGELLVMDEH